MIAVTAGPQCGMAARRRAHALGARVPAVPAPKGRIAQARREIERRIAAQELLAISHLRHFVRFAWPVIEPATKLVWNWHIDRLCDELEEVTEDWAAGKGCELVICIPPGHMKSLIVSVFWPAWQWLQHPGVRTLHLANSDDLVHRDSRRTKDIITSDWYDRLRYRVAHVTKRTWELRKDQNKINDYANTLGGARFCLSIGSKVTGQRGDMILIDDPHDAKETILGSAAQIGIRMAIVSDIYRAAVNTRLNDLQAGVRVLIMQRLHPRDLAAWIMANPTPYARARRIILPAEYDPQRADPKDPRVTPGEPLFPLKYPTVVLNALKGAASMGVHYLRQFLQLDTAIEGSIFTTPGIFIEDPQRCPMDHTIMSVDATFKDKSTSDFVVIQIWGKRGRNYYLLDQYRARMNYPATRTIIRSLCLKWPTVSCVLIEDKANGSALIDDLVGQIPNVTPFEPGATSKIARAQIAARVVADGRVFAPPEAYAPWVKEWRGELKDFPEAEHDDQVDATSQALIFMEHRVTSADAIRREFAGLFDGDAFMRLARAA